MAKGDDIEERLIGYAVRIVNVCSNLPKNQVGRHLADQLLRSGTAPAALYAEARTAESQKDFIHKLRIALKEANESRVWLIIVMKCDLIPASRLNEPFGRMQRHLPHPELKHTHSPIQRPSESLITAHQPSTINHQPQPSTINHQPSTINHQPSTIPLRDPPIQDNPS